jgi:CHAD domain-containing protein
MAKNKQIKWDEKSGPAANARRALPSLAARYFADVRARLSENPAPPDLHVLRLATKRLRYTLELFRPCYGPGLETKLNALRRIQSVLGGANDIAVAVRMLSDSMPPSPARERLLRTLAQRAEEKAGEFRKLWTEAFDAPGLEAAWTTYLARNARARK